jgi:glycoprotein-N-acetylgalactosamine 3-beta-galactosyltransferase
LLILRSLTNSKSTPHDVQSTWGRRCNKLLFVTKENNTATSLLLLSDVETDKEHNATDMMSIIQLVYDSHIDDADWFLQVSLRVHVTSVFGSYK